MRRSQRAGWVKVCVNAYMYIICVQCTCVEIACVISLRVLYSFLVQIDLVMLHILMNNHAYSGITNVSSPCFPMWSSG